MEFVSPMEVASSTGIPARESLSVGRRVSGALLLAALAWAALDVPAVAVAQGAAAPVGDAAIGEITFEKCQKCHTVGLSTADGPDLVGVFGRASGGAQDFEYSPALKGGAITWDEAALRAFLTGPEAKAPGTTMKLEQLPPEDLADIIAYLKTLRED